MMRYALKNLLTVALAIGLTAFMAPEGYSQDIRVEAEVSSQKVTLGSAIQFTITIHGNSNIEPIQLPPIDGFEAKYIGPSTRISYINGLQSSSKSFTYSLLPLREGKFQIPAFDVMIFGKAHIIHSVPLEVVAFGGRAGLSPNSQPTGNQARLFSALKVPKKEVYFNESLPLKILIYISNLSISDCNPPELNSIGYSFENFEKRKQYQQIINGIRYTIFEYNTTVFPMRIGKLQIGPAKVVCGVLVEPSSRSRRITFQDKFFNSFFDTRQVRPFELEAEGVSINVLSLPEEGKPNDFSGAVGKYSFNISVSPNHINEGDPITLRMTILGKGNLSAIQMPSLSLKDNFKIYDPQIFEKDGVKKSEQVIIPQSADITEVPTIRFAYFDPQLKIYRTITKGPFPIHVAKLKDGEGFKVVGFNGEYRPFESEKFGEDIVFIKAKPGKFQLFEQHAYNSSVFYFVMILSVMTWVGAFVNYKRTDRIKTDIVYARRLLAPRKAKQGLVLAKNLIDSGNKEKFYDATFKTIQEYLGNKLHLSSGAVTFETVQSKLVSKNIEQNAIDEIKVIFEECDMIRYASADISQDDLTVSYQRLVKTIDSLERHLK